MSRLAILLLVILGWATSASATTYYVRTDGNNANTGTANTSGGAWRTIDKGYDTAAAGDTVRVQAGTYLEAVSPGVSGSAGNTVTVVADGTVITCSLLFSAKSYIRTIGLTVDPTTAGCADPGYIVRFTGTNTGLEFWNNAFNNEPAGNAVAGDGTERCTACLFIGGQLHTIGGGSTSVSAMSVVGNDLFVGYVDFAAICYLGVNPAGSRQRFVNLNFSGMIQCAAAHPDFFYPQGLNTFGWSNNLVESVFGIGTTTSNDNKYFHAQNQQSTAWVDDVWRFNVSYNLGSGFFSLYDSNGALTRWRFYHNTIVNCQRANNSSPYDNCGNLSAQAGNGVSASIYDNLFYQAWADIVTSTIPVWSESFSPTVTKDYNLAFDPDGSVTFAAQWTGQANEQSNVNPQLTNVATADLTLQATSGARGVGGPLTTATSCSGTTLNVATNTGSFFIGSNASNVPQYGGALVPGDFLTVNSTTYQVSSVSGDALTLTSAITCSNGAAVYFGTSSTIDIGAYPYKAGGYGLSATYTIGGGTATITPNDPSLVRFVVCYDSTVPTAVVNASPFTCTVGSGTFSARVYPRYASQTLWADAALAGDVKRFRIMRRIGEPDLFPLTTNPPAAPRAAISRGIQ